MLRIRNLPSGSGIDLESKEEDKKKMRTEEIKTLFEEHQETAKQLN